MESQALGLSSMLGSGESQGQSFGAGYQSDQDSRETQTFEEIQTFKEDKSRKVRIQEMREFGYPNSEVPALRKRKRMEGVKFKVGEELIGRASVHAAVQKGPEPENPFVYHSELCRKGSAEPAIKRTIKNHISHDHEMGGKD